MITTFIRKLPAPAEFCLVLFVCCWWVMYAGLGTMAGHPERTAGPVQKPIIGVGLQLGVNDHQVIIMQVLASGARCWPAPAFAPFFRPTKGSMPSC
jgi:hypothetical protein